MLQWTERCRHLSKTATSFFSDIYSEMGSLDHVIVQLLIFWRTFILHSGCTNFQLQQHWAKAPFSPHPCQHLLSLMVVLAAILMVGASPVAQQSRMCLQFRRCERCRLDPWVGKIPWRKKWQSIPVFLPRKSHGQRSYSPWCRKQTWLSAHARARTHTHTHTHTPTGVRWQHIVVLIYRVNSQIISETEHLFMYLLAICISSLEKWLFRSFSVFIWIYFWLLSYMSSLYILDINPLSDRRSTSIFSHSVGCLFILSIVSFVIEAF